MSRVNLDAAVGWPQGDSTPFTSSRSLDEASGRGAFGRHLDEAHRTAEASSGGTPRSTSGGDAASRSNASSEENLRNSRRDRSPESADNENVGEDPNPAAESSRESPSPKQRTADPSGPEGGGKAKEATDDDTGSDSETRAGSDAAAGAAVAAMFVPEPVEDATVAEVDAPPADAAESVKANASPSAASGLAADIGGGPEEASHPANQSPRPDAASQAAVDLAPGEPGAVSSAENPPDVAAKEAPAESSQRTEPPAVSPGLPVRPSETPGDLPAGRYASEGDADPGAEVVESPGQAALADPAATEEDPSAPPSLLGRGRRSSTGQESQVYGEGQPAANATQVPVPGGRVSPDPPALLAGTRPAASDRPAAGSESKDAAGPATSNTSSDGKPAGPVAVQVSGMSASEDAVRQRGDLSQGDAAERARFVQRVARALESAADRAGQVRLRLHPPELGSVRLDLTIRNGHMTARMETETQSAQSMLLDNLPALKERLAEHRITVERFEVAWQGQTQGGLSQDPGDQARWQMPSTGHTPTLAGKARGGTGTDGVGQTPRRLTPGTSFDVVI